MTETRPNTELVRTLTVRDVVLLNLACLLGFSSLAQVAQFGFGSILVWLLAACLFLVPSGITVAVLSARMPEEGGLYRWTRMAFGDAHGYIAAWSYWLSTVVWLPTVLLLVSLSALYVGGSQWLALADAAWYHAAVCIGFVWLITGLNIIGLGRAKWVQNVGSVATWCVMALLVAAGSFQAVRVGSMHPFTVSALIPDLSDVSLLPFLAIALFSFGGLELAPFMAGEIRDPARTIRRALPWSMIVATVLYMAGTVMVVIAIPEGDVGIIEGVAQSFHAMGQTLGIQWLGSFGAILILLSTVGLFGAWMTGNARIPFVIGLDRFLPPVMGTVHPRFRTPWVSLVVQAVVLSLLLLASVIGSTLEEAYLVLLDMSIIMYFIPFLYMFAAMWWHVGRYETILALVAATGFLVTAFSMVMSAFPTDDITNVPLFLVKVLGGAAFLIGVGMVPFLLRGKRGKAA